MNIHIGCEHKIGKSWLNYDISYVAVYEKIPFFGKVFRINNKRYPTEVKYGDISKNTLCDDNAADNIYCSHTLEHMTLNGMKSALQNIYKMLKPGGCFRLIVPDLKCRVERYLKDKDSDYFIKNIGMGKIKNNQGIINRLRNIFGNSNHQWMYDEISMKKYLIDTGFINIRKCEFGDSGILAFSEVEEKHRFIDNEFIEVSFQCSK